MASCLPCIPGSYSDTDKAIICKDCDIGQYRPSQIEVNGVMTDTELTKCKYTKIGLNIHQFFFNFFHFLSLVDSK